MKRVDNIEVVESFLKKVHGLIDDNSFNIQKNFWFQEYRRNYSENHKYNNHDTLVELDYGLQDVVNEINSLSTEQYKETIEDDRIGNVQPFYCFIKIIKGRQVYIKFKLAEHKKKYVFCVSFHFAEYFVSEADLPYSNSI